MKTFIDPNGVSRHLGPAPDEVAAELAQAAKDQFTICVTVGIPLCSDGERVRFGSGVYDPFEEKRLLSLPEVVSEATNQDLSFAAELAAALRRQAPRTPTMFCISAFDAKMVHSLGACMAGKIEDHVAKNLAKLLPDTGRELLAKAPGRIGINFSLRYRRIGDKFADRLRRLVRPPVPAVPTSQALEIFETTGAVLLKQLDSDLGRKSGMGRVVFATTNTVNDEDLDPLHGRGAVQRALGAVILTDQHGEYICEVTAMGRLLALSQNASDVAPGRPVIAYSIVNVQEPGSYKLHRITWAAGEVLDTVSPLLSNAFPIAGNQYWARVSDGERSVTFDSRLDHARRDRFLKCIQARVSKRPSKRLELLAGQIESLRSRVQTKDPDRTSCVLLSGPGDYTSEYVTGRRARQLRDNTCDL